jgi:guanylate kinase
MLREEFPTVKFSVSYTTRPMRKGESNGVDYHFVDKEAFDQMVAREEFAEWAVVHGNQYGTSRRAVDQALDQGEDVVFDVDYQGGRALMAKWPAESLMIFILPPDWRTLEDRLRRRATDSDEVIRRRLTKALDELEYHKEYKHRVVNEEIEPAYDALRAIYRVRKFGANHQAVTDRDRELFASSQGQSPYEHAESLIAGAKAARSSG